MANEVEEALHKRLAGHSGVSGKVGSRIYPDNPPQNPSTPFLTYELVSRPYVSAMGDDTDARPVFQVTAWDTTKKGARDTSVEIKNALRRIRGTISTGSGSFEVKSSFVQTEIDRFDDETELEGRQVDIQLTHGV